METIKLDLVPGKKMPSLHASQYDNETGKRFELCENRVPFKLDGDETLSIIVRKVDNTLVSMDVANVFGGKTYVDFLTTEQMCACAGYNFGELRIERNGERLGTGNFYLCVEQAPDEGGITSQSEINNLARQVHDIVVEELEDNGAEQTGYDNTESGLEATNVQDAIDEVNTKINNIPSVDAYTKQESDSFLADEYDATQTYAVGDYRIHEGGLYVCNTPITTPEVWNGAHWTLTDVATALEHIPTKTSQLQNDSGFTQIDDTTESASKTWSSEKIEGELDTKLDTSEIYEPSDNKYNPALQTPETISPHYYVNGVPYSTTQFDNAYNCTDFIEVKPNTTYTIAIVPAYNSITKPWNESSSGLFLYDSGKNYLNTHFETNTFTTTATTKYIRFNYFRSGGTGITLDVLNTTCMLVEGSVIPTTYQDYKGVNKLDYISKAPLQYKIGTDSIDILQGYGNKNMLITMNKHGGNNIFDYASFATVDKSLAIQNITNNDKTIIQNISTDWHSPFQVRATSDIDGDNINPNTSNYYVYFTGGNHQYNNSGSGSTATGRTTSIKFFATGNEVVSGQYGYANSIRIEWTNRVQGYNTTKANGTGREIIEEKHTIVVDGEKFKEFCEVRALEGVVFKRFYGLQVTGTKTVYNNIHYVGATNRGIYSGLVASNSGNKLTNEMIGYGTYDKVRCGIDCSYDLGRRDNLNETKGFFVEIYDKGYSNLLNVELTVSADDSIYYRGYYIFSPI